MPEKKPINWTNARTLAALAILVGTELVGASWAAGWALGGLFQLGAGWARAIELAFVAIGFFGLYYFMRTAIAHEPVRR
ncbi:hypothetical protein QM467_14545 [Rhodoblastus sp. 17X3]|uniref:hypothetical protein n=1 Tax=Rhodoblastus sp. 17X3 TaxID=3047026 RepID=UPI0024B7E6A1|nr:hypothetical protein [Rhodoblastus sp. 17X3]MDI9849274.1 hypothetical protein [Rhodoblastus sp. 17X3]